MANRKKKESVTTTAPAAQPGAVVTTEAATPQQVTQPTPQPTTPVTPATPAQPQPTTVAAQPSAPAVATQPTAPATTPLPPPDPIPHYVSRVLPNGNRIMTTALSESDLAPQKTLLSTPYDKQDKKGDIAPPELSKRDYVNLTELAQRLAPLPTEADREREAKRAKRESILAALGDGISALTNLVFTTKGAPNVPQTAGMSKAAKERQERLRAEWQAQRDKYNNLMLYLAGKDRDFAFEVKKFDYAKGEAEKENKRKDAKNEADILLLMGKYGLTEAQARKAAEEARKAKAEADMTPAKINSEIDKNKSATAYNYAAAKKYENDGKIIIDSGNYGFFELPRGAYNPNTLGAMMSFVPKEMITEAGNAMGKSFEGLFGSKGMTEEDMNFVIGYASGKVPALRKYIEDLGGAVGGRLHKTKSNKINWDTDNSIDWED